MGEDRRRLAPVVERQEQLALAVRGEELRPGAPDSPRARRSLDDAGGRPEGSPVDELSDPVLVVLRPRPLDRGGVVGLDDAHGPARHARPGRRRAARRSTGSRRGSPARRRGGPSHPRARGGASVLRVFSSETYAISGRPAWSSASPPKPSRPPLGAVATVRTLQVPPRCSASASQCAAGSSASSAVAPDRADREADDEHARARKAGDRLFGSRCRRRRGRRRRANRPRRRTRPAASRRARPPASRRMRRPSRHVLRARGPAVTSAAAKRAEATATASARRFTRGTIPPGTLVLELDITHVLVRGIRRSAGLDPMGRCMFGC